VGRGGRGYRDARRQSRQARVFTHCACESHCGGVALAGQRCVGGASPVWHPAQGHTREPKCAESPRLRRADAPRQRSGRPAGGQRPVCAAVRSRRVSCGVVGGGAAVPPALVKTRIPGVARTWVAATASMTAASNMVLDTPMAVGLQGAEARRSGGVRWWKQVTGAGVLGTPHHRSTGIRDARAAGRPVCVASWLRRAPQVRPRDRQTGKQSHKLRGAMAEAVTRHGHTSRYVRWVPRTSSTAGTAAHTSLAMLRGTSKMQQAHAQMPFLPPRPAFQHAPPASREPVRATHRVARILRVQQDWRSRET
jgi:hypothetical protein